MFDSLVFWVRKHLLKKHFTEPDIHQLNSNTGLNRYPKIFNSCRNYFTDEKFRGRIHILSYGCSTGEECFTLRDYFPEAHITGADINKKNLQKCLRRNKDENIVFIYSNEENISANSPYQMIFCMSVFCVWPLTKHKNNIESIYNFNKFEEALTLLDSKLAVNGLLVIYNSNFLFSDSKVFSKYRVLKDPHITESGFVHKFSKQHIKLPDFNYEDCIFIKEK